MTKIYSYHPYTREYLNESITGVDPIEGKPLISAFATIKKPPPVKLNQCAVFINDDWIIEVDFRGTDYWLNDGKKYTINKLGEYLPTDALTEPPAPSLEKLKENAITSVKSFATSSRAKLTGYADQYQLAGWVGKAEIAKRVVAGTATDQETASIQAEVDRRGQGETVEELANKQLAKSTQLNIAAAIADGVESAAITAIESTQANEELDTLMASLLVDAESELNDLFDGAQ